MTEWGMLALVAAGSYAMGCVTAAYYLVRLRTGTDLRTVGSGTAGATNAGRVLGPWAYVTAALLDMGKAAAAVALAGWLVADPVAPLVALVGVVVGHIWPAQLGFRGGKGAAAGFGGMLVIAPVVALLALGAALAVLATTRKYHLGGQVGLVVAPFLGWWQGLGAAEMVGLIVTVAILLLVQFTRRSRVDVPEPV